MSSDKLDYALLLAVMCGRKYLPNCELSNHTHYDAVIVKKGTLLKAVTSEECHNITKQFRFLFNYKVMDDNNIKLQCNAAEVHELTNRQMQLLQAVEHLQDRIEVVHKLE